MTDRAEAQEATMVDHVAYEIWKDGKKDGDALTYQDLTVADCADGYEARPLVYLSDYAELEAENARYAEELAGAAAREEILKSEIDQLHAEALPHTDAVKLLPRPDAVSMTCGTIHLEYEDRDRRDTAYDWLENHAYAPLSALEPAATEVRQEARRNDRIEGAVRGLERLKSDFAMKGANATTIERAIQALRTLSRPAEQAVTSFMRGCATDGCDKKASVHFERGGIGSDYCHDCYMRVQALTQEKGR
jgi:hypothetical protein